VSFFARKRYVPPVYAERGYEWAAIGYHPNPNVVTDQQDNYVRVAPDPPFSVAWQGVQRPNAASELAQASVHLGFSPSIGAGMPAGSWVAAGEMGNPLQYRQPQAGGLVRRFAVGDSSVGTMGPGTGWAPNPTATDPADSTSYTYNAAADAPSLLSSIRSKLGI
jgi:hypothetical protein